MRKDQWHKFWKALIGATVTAIHKEENGITLTMSTGKNVKFSIDYDDVDLDVKVTDFADGV
jgi:hypothetical protein